MESLFLGSRASLEYRTTFYENWWVRSLSFKGDLVGKSNRETALSSGNDSFAL